MQDTARSEDGALVGAGMDGWETIRYRTLWTCEKWEEDAVDYVRANLGLPRLSGVGSAVLRTVLPPDTVEQVAGNMLLNEGIQEMIDLLIAAAGTTAYNNANAQIGVGDSAAAEAATQLDLQAATNKLFKAQVATYPIRTNQTVDFRSDFLTAEANWVWNEWSIRNGATRDKNLNRKVQSLGTKTTGTWTLTASITFS